MTWWQAILLGIVEGITEFLPVSSTGHLLVVQDLLGLARNDAANAYAICIQAGAIAAVLLVFSRRLRSMGEGLVGRDPAGRRLLLLVFAAFFPAAVLGPILDDPIESVLFGPWPIVAAWVAGAAVILWLRGRSAAGGGALEQLEGSHALVIGLVQCLAMWPGTSRSLATIAGGLLVGLSLAAAVEFSFLLGLVTLGAATAYKALGHGDEMIAAYGPGPIALGFLAAAGSAFFSARWMISWLSRHGLGVFAIWRLVAAALVVGWLLLASGP